MKSWMTGGTVFVVCGLLILAANCTSVKKNNRNNFKKPAEDSRLADNSFCYVCHANYDGEQLASMHKSAGIACAKCHGPSFAHSGDENNITPPDIMYPTEKINPSCMECHLKKQIEKVGDHQPILSGTATQDKYCTDCHGKAHRIAVRTVRWDKTTGKLLK